MRCPICDNEIKPEVYRIRKDLCHECDQSISDTRNDFGAFDFEDEISHENEESTDPPPVPKVWIK